MSSPEHTHRTHNENGRETCLDCRQVIIDPIFSSDDPRLIQQSKPEPEPDFPPLPELLIGLYFNGPAIGLPKAPVAPYIEQVAQLEGERSEGRADMDELWLKLYKKTV